MMDGLDLLHKEYIQAIFESHHAGFIDLQAAVQLALIGGSTSASATTR